MEIPVDENIIIRDISCLCLANNIIILDPFQVIASNNVLAGVLARSLFLSLAAITPMGGCALDLAPTHCQTLLFRALY